MAFRRRHQQPVGGRFALKDLEQKTTSRVTPRAASARSASRSASREQKYDDQSSRALSMLLSSQDDERTEVRQLQVQIKSLEASMQRQMNLFERLQKRNVEAITELRAKQRQSDTELLEARQQIMLLQNGVTQQAQQVQVQNQQAGQMAVQQLDGSPRRADKMKEILAKFREREKADAKQAEEIAERDHRFWAALEEFRNRAAGESKVGSRVQAELNARMLALEERLRPKEEQIEQLQDRTVSRVADVVSVESQNQIRKLSDEISVLSHRLAASDLNRERLEKLLVEHREAATVELQNMRRNVMNTLQRELESRRRAQEEQESSNLWKKQHENDTVAQRMGAINAALERLEAAQSMARTDWMAALHASEKRQELKYQTSIADLRRATTLQTEETAHLHSRLEGAVKQIAGVVASETNNTGGELQALGKETQNAVVALRDLIDETDARFQSQMTALEEVVRAEVRQRLSDKGRFKQMIAEAQEEEELNSKQALMLIKTRMKELDVMKKDLEAALKTLRKSQKDARQSKLEERKMREDMGVQLQKSIDITYAAVDTVRAQLDASINDAAERHQRNNDLLRKAVTDQLAESRIASEKAIDANKASLMDAIKSRVAVSQQLLSSRIEGVLQDFSALEDAMDRSALSVSKQQDELRTYLMRHAVSTVDASMIDLQRSFARKLEISEEAFETKMKREKSARAQENKAILSSLREMSASIGEERKRDLAQLESTLLSSVNEVELKIRGVADVQASRTESLELRLSASVDGVRRVVDDTRAELRAAVESVERSMESQREAFADRVKSQVDQQMTALRIRMSAQLKAESAKRLQSLDDTEKGMNAKLDAVEDLLRAERMSSLQQLESKMTQAMSEETALRLRADEKIQSSMESLLDGKMGALRRETGELFTLPSMLDSLVASEKKERVEDAARNAAEARELVAAVREVVSARMDEAEHMRQDLRGLIEKEQMERMKQDQSVRNDLLKSIESISKTTEIDKEGLQAQLNAIASKNKSLRETVSTMGAHVSKMETNVSLLDSAGKRYETALEREREIMKEIQAKQDEESKHLQKLDNEQNERLNQLRLEQAERLQNLNNSWKSSVKASKMVANQRKKRVEAEARAHAEKAAAIVEHQKQLAEKEEKEKNRRKEELKLKLSHHEAEAKRLHSEAQKALVAHKELEETHNKLEQSLKKMKKKKQKEKAEEELAKLKEEMKIHHKKAETAKEKAKEAAVNVEDSRVEKAKSEKSKSWKHGDKRICIVPNIGKCDETKTTALRVMTDKEYGKPCFVFIPKGLKNGQSFDAEAKALKTTPERIKVPTERQNVNLDFDLIDHTTKDGRKVFAFIPASSEEGSEVFVDIPAYDPDGNLIELVDESFEIADNTIAEIDKAANDTETAGEQSSKSRAGSRWSRSKKPKKGRMTSAAKKGSIKKMKKYINNEGDIHEEDKLGNTPLHHACAQGNVDMLKLLIDSGADITKVNKRGETPLHLAAKEDHLPILQHLSKHEEFDVAMKMKNEKGQFPSELTELDEFKSKTTKKEKGKIPSEVTDKSKTTKKEKGKITSEATDKSKTTKKEKGEIPSEVTDKSKTTKKEKGEI
eukprot:g5778.t1